MVQKILEVPYRSQNADDAASHNTDCGPTCVAMILNYYGINMTPDQGYRILAREFNREFGEREYTRTRDLKNLLTFSGVPTTFNSFPDKTSARQMLVHHINNDRPFIALVNYVPFQQWTGQKFTGSHFVVVCGYDDNHVYIHDPIFNPNDAEKGSHFKLTYDQFAEGWGSFRRSRIDNPDWHLIHPIRSLHTQVAPPVTPKPQPPKPAPPVTPPVVAPKPVDPEKPPIDFDKEAINDEVEKRIEALAAWHGRTVDWDNGGEVQIWFDHLGSFGREYASHQVAAGQTLSAISAIYYSRQDKWKAIKAYNRLAFEWANAGQWLRVPLFGTGSAHLTEPVGLPPKLEAFEFEEELIEAPEYESLAPHSEGMGMVESDDIQIDDSEAAGFASDPDVTQVVFKPGEPFKAIWTFLNTGTTTWDDAYQIAHLPRTPDHTGGMATGQFAAKTVYKLDEVGNKGTVRPGETVTVTIDLSAPNVDGVVATHWQMQNPDGEYFGKIRWISGEFSADATFTPTPTPVPTPPPPPVVDPPDPTPTPDPGTPFGNPHQTFIPIMNHPKKVQVSFGMNINPNLDNGDPREIDSRDVDIDNQRGLGWVRYAYWASRNRRSGKEAFVKRYRQLIKSYADAGVKTLIVLHQDAYWGRGPWDNGGWGAYAAEYARECAEVANACAEFKDMVAYQIFNETDSEWGDDAGNYNPSAIGIPPEKYAIILQSAAKAIRAVDPKATIVASGMKTGPVNAVNYLKKVQQTLRKPLPVDALAYHPYGRHAKSTFDFVPFGSLSDAFRPFETAFPKLPIWLTEIGVPGHQHVFPPNRYPDISTFMNETIELLETQHAKQVPVVIWFAWSDYSENSGIKTKDGQFKSGIKEAYDKMRNIS